MNSRGHDTYTARSIYTIFISLPTSAENIKRMKNLLQIILIVALINFSGGQQVLLALYNSCTSEIQSQISANFVEEEIHETEDSNQLDEDEVEVEQECAAITEQHKIASFKKSSEATVSGFLIPDSQAEDHTPPPESAV
jgi:hypothetical protein